ncbi:SDR family NAD(P)-dependent oxidoreductase [Synechococcus sp. TAK9802]|uniref:SDR family NAD(P)-dependent oxidoreductase n=1 Tax=Synechococcus sp. TAK9802 TaxID=1442558 RepID=UPI001647BCBF|nr:SDR family oxidoreductase [Synechococcus sp. TAK9802]QNI60495.1 glucose/ribitol dehydrogenase [Synechococcus sp. TAK9802]
MQEIVLTGVSKGFGKQLLLSLSEKYFIHALTRSPEDISFAVELEQQNKIKLYYADLASINEVDAFCDQVLANSNQLLGIINNAGRRFRSSIDTIEYSDLCSLFDVNIHAPFFIIKNLLPLLKKNKYSRIINISSIVGYRGFDDLSGYGMTKGAINSMTKCLASELAEHQVTVNAILPGFCETSYADKFKSNLPLYESTIIRTPLKRWGADTELNGIVEFLLSTHSSYMTGSLITMMVAGLQYDS